MAFSTEAGQQSSRAKRKELEIDKLYRALVKFEGNDLAPKVGLPPFVGLPGPLRPLSRESIND